MKDWMYYSDTSLNFDHYVSHDKQGQYFTLPFKMIEGAESVSISYRYARYESDDPGNDGPFYSRQEINIIDLGLIDPFGRQVGASGSDKSEITVSETDATPGYRPTTLVEGQWEILVGAYKVHPKGVTVNYEVNIKTKSPRWLRGDLQTHTVASDGVHTAGELAWKGLRNGLQFAAITDHNQMVERAALPKVEGFTLIPGVEWTHYQGHALFLGVDQPYDEPFAANTFEEMQARFVSARQRGALIILAHPFEGGNEFKLDLQKVPFDCIEVWNGPMRESNLRAVGLWQHLLMSGMKVAATGGSDYHRDTPFIFLGGPTTCVYALSTAPRDILAALRAGNSYITFVPNGPSAEFNAGEAMMGDSVAWAEVKEVQIVADGLIPGDVVRLVTKQGNVDLLEAPSLGRFETRYEVTAPGFARLEVWRAFLPGIPKLPALLTNPIYFDE